MSTPEADRAYYENGIEEIERYLLSNELYWPCHSRTPDLTQLTPGGLLLVRARLRGWGASDLDVLDARLDEVRSKWHSAWDGKTRREVHARSELWREFLSGYHNDPRGTARLYPQHVRQRVIIALLGESSDPMDGLLKNIFRPSVFIWDAKLQSGFPQQVFWFLYGTISTEAKS
jgi:hypothetical protein